MNSLDLQLQLNVGATITTTVANTVFANVLNQSTVQGHVENQLDQVGLFIPFSAVTLTGSQTYQFQVISDSASNLTTTPIVCADTGAMGVTDGRLTNSFYVWLPIPFGVVIQQYVGARYSFTNSPSMTIGGAWLAPLSAIQNFLSYPLNYVP